MTMSMLEAVLLMVLVAAMIRAPSSRAPDARPLLAYLAVIAALAVVLILRLAR